MDMAALASGLLNVGSKAGTPAAPSADQYTDAYAKAVAICDQNDGLVDGYLTNPAACNVDPAVLQCGKPLANLIPWLCLSAPQVATLQGLLADLKFNTGAVAYSKYAWANFGGFLGAAGPGGGGLGGGFALLATNDALWLIPIFGKQASFDLNRDFYIIRDGLLLRGADHQKAAIAAFVASGKKLLSWNDSGDPLVSASDHVRNHDAMTDIAKSLGLGDPRTNTRLFMVPASDHGAGGDFSSVDWLSAIIDWVESNKPPTQLTYSFSVGTTARTLPVCEYPAYPRYNGSGNVNAASSFTCTPP
jgi:feruloyl esterase